MRHLIPLLIVPLAACAPDELEAQRQVWAERGGSDYRVTVQRQCFCPDTDPVEVTVTGGEVVQAIRSPLPGGTGSAEPLDAADYEDWFTVDGLFAVVEAALEQADDVAVRYDPTLGHPTSIEIDWIGAAIDDEVSYRVTDLALE